jgi:hypothetical protein
MLQHNSSDLLHRSVPLLTANSAEDGPDSATTNETDGGDNAWFKPALKRTQSVRNAFEWFASFCSAALQ